MGVLTESLVCFCKGVSKSERMKCSIFTGKAPAMARISGGGTGFLIHRNLLLTTHGNLPSVAAAASDGSEIHLQDGVSATLVPNRFFITSSILDLTIVGLDILDGDVNTPGHYLKTSSKPSLDLGSIVYLLGYTHKHELTVGEGKVVIATDNLIKLVSTDGLTWSPGAAGFDSQGNLAFLICDPMKLATSPNTKSSSTSSSSASSWKKDLPTHFGIPIPVICDWLNQHWEGSLDDLNKPKLPLIRLMSTGQRSEHSCASFAMRQVFKSTDDAEDDDKTTSSSNKISRLKDHQNANEDETLVADQLACRLHGISTPEIYESPMFISTPIRKKENTQIQLLDINFPPRTLITPSSNRKLPPNSDENCIHDSPLQNRFKGAIAGSEIASTGSVNGAHVEVQSSSSSVEVAEVNGGYSSDGETMYSAETAESRNYTITEEGKVGRSKSCVNYNNRWGQPAQSNPMARRALLEKQRSFIHGRKVCSQRATSQRSNFYSPTVSSILKKQNSMDKPNRSRQSAVVSSSRRIS